MSLTVRMQGQDITAYVQEGTIDVESSLGISTGYSISGLTRTMLCKFRTKLGPAALAYGPGSVPHTGGPYLVRKGEVVVQDGASIVFGGFVTILDDATDFTRIYTDVEAHDYWQELAATLVNTVYESTTDLAILRDIVANWSNWVTLDPSTTGTPNIIAKKVWRGKPITECIQELCKITGFAAWVDDNKVLHYESPNALPNAPFAVSDVPDMVSSFPHIVTKYEQDDTSIINRVVFLGGKLISNDFTQDLSPQANGSNLTFVLAYYPHVAKDGMVHVYLNGVEEKLGRANSKAVAANVFISQGGTAYALLDAGAQNITFDTGKAPSNSGPNSVTVKYRYLYPLAVEVTDTLSYQYFGKYYDARVVDQTVFDLPTAYTRSKVVLAQQNFGLLHVTLLTYQPGLRAGQLLKITNAVRGISGEFRIQKVTLKPQGGGVTWYEVELGAWDWTINDVIMQAASHASPQDTTTDETLVNLIFHETNTAMNISSSATAPTNPSGLYYVGVNAYAGNFTITS